MLRCQLPVGTKEAMIERMVLSFVSKKYWSGVLPAVSKFLVPRRYSAFIFTTAVETKITKPQSHTLKFLPNSDHKLCDLTQCPNQAVDRMSEEESPAQRVVIGISFGNSYSSIAHTSGVRIPLSLIGKNYNFNPTIRKAKRRS